MGPVYKPAPAPSADQALLYLYRTDTMAFAGRTMVVSLDGAPWAELRNNGYAVKHVPPGEHTVSAYWAKWLGDPASMQVPLQLKGDLKGGETYYLRIRPSVVQSSSGGNIVQTSRWELTAVPAQQATREIAGARGQ